MNIERPKKGVLATVAKDFQLAYDGTRGRPLRRTINCLRDVCLQAIVIYRFGHWLLSQPFLVRFFLKPLFYWQFHRIRSKWGIQISPRAAIGNGLAIFHPGGIFIAAEAILGDNVVLSQGVTIGLAGEGDKRGAPRIGNNVYIGPGAKISGKIVIGNHVRINANAVVQRSLPDNSLVQIQMEPRSTSGDERERGASESPPEWHI